MSNRESTDYEKERPTHQLTVWSRVGPFSSVQFSSVAQSCPTLCNPMNCSTPDLPVLHQLQSLPKPMSIELMMPSNCLILCRPLLLLPSIFPSIGVFSNESDLCIRWPKYWSFSFNISPSNEHPGLIWKKKQTVFIIFIHRFHCNLFSKIK